MSTLDVPCDGRASFHRLGVLGLLGSLLADEARRKPVPGPPTTIDGTEIITTYLRSVAYVMRGLGA